LSRRQHHTGPTSLVFCTPAGHYLDDSRLRRRYAAALKAAGLPPLRLHDLRHCFGTLAVQAWPLTDVHGYMGHAAIATTMIYVPHAPAHDAADKRGALVAAAVAAPQLQAARAA